MQQSRRYVVCSSYFAPGLAVVLQTGHQVHELNHQSRVQREAKWNQRPPASAPPNPTLNTTNRAASTREVVASRSCRFLKCQESVLIRMINSETASAVGFVSLVTDFLASFPRESSIKYQAASPHSSDYAASLTSLYLSKTLPSLALLFS